ncbi:MAG: hemerythrin domain-containing protein, partial [Acidimicrobiia bacterium]|nr:hemerythrin domain-containing protein [Acidimicrobiia bacterium]
ILMFEATDARVSSRDNTSQHVKGARLMDAISVLTDDHHKARGLFTAFRAASEADDAEQMGSVAEKIFEELDTHTAIEERVFYPALKEAGGSDLEELTDESNEEHHVVDVLMKELKEISPSDPAYPAKMTVLMENVEHHAGEEEKEMFPKVRNIFSETQLKELGLALHREKHVYRLENKSVDELHKEAAELEIAGRSELDREGLVSAILSEYDV